MSDSTPQTTSRREFFQTSGRLATATALAGMLVPSVHASEDNTIRLALVGCGGRGTGAVRDAMATKQGPLKLVAMADVMPEKLQKSHDALKDKLGESFADVPHEHRFIGFDAYRKAMDLLRPGDVVLLTTPPAFRWVQFTYAIEKGLNVFMEKPVSVDGPTSRKMFALGEQSIAKGLKVGVGLMCRHCTARRELVDRIRDGQIGDILFMRAYRMAGPVGTAISEPRPKDFKSELLWQISRFHSFLWASGGCYSDFLIHNIDECSWAKDAWPVKAQALGGRTYRGDQVDQNFDSYAVEYTYPDGTKLFLDGRCMAGCNDEFASYAHGTKGAAIISAAGNLPAKSRIYKGQNMVKKNVLWSAAQPEPDPYVNEWEELLEAIRNNKPYNEVKRGVEASLVTSMGRMAAHTGQVITYEQILNHEHEFAPHVDQLTLDGPAPLLADADGKYPVPRPGLITKREY